jgi:tubulin polyglutamylase TTLL1/tubulin monoglycylase TTLL3/8
MFDSEFKPYLIEVNTNPSLDLPSPNLCRLIPSMLENSFRIAVDPLFPPNEGFAQRKTTFAESIPLNRYELIFCEDVDGPYLEELAKKQPEIIEFDEDELSSACGSENNEPLEALEAADAFLIKTDADDAADLLIE